MSQPTFYWHDYETWGADPSRDRPSQFAGIRTDADLNEIGEPLSIYCQPSPDIVPHPEACLVTGITPQQALEQGLPEHAFVARIHRELAAPNTCGVGYNSMRFDDEVTRFTLYRNFYDPYEREYKNGNSRWDLIDIARLCRAVRPQGIQWPDNDEGLPSFKLERLSAANGISHDNAHDALSDVRATIALARLIKQQQPRLFDYGLSLRSKQQVAALLDVAAQKPVLHISGRIASARCCGTLVAPLAWHPSNRNSVIVYDLAVDPTPLLQMDAEQIKARVFASAEDLPEGAARIPLKEIHINRAPVVATAKLVDEAAARRMQLDLAACRRHWEQLRAASGLSATLREVYSDRQFEPITDPERMLYSGGFFSDEDKQLMAQVRAADAQALASTTYAFSDRRLPELLFRYRGRNFPETLSADEYALWEEWCHERRTQPDAGGSITAQACLQRIAALQAGDLTPAQQSLLSELAEYVENI